MPPCPAALAPLLVASLVSSGTKGPCTLVLDSTGLRLFGQGKWDAQKHGRTRQQWRKLHLALDANTGESAIHSLTTGNAEDSVQAPGLLRQAENCVAIVIADGACNSDAGYQAATRQQEVTPDQVIPPRIPGHPPSRSLRDLAVEAITRTGS